ncbi:type III-A CRISPR-associated RAMP protein Csm5 [Flectobacillus roseus]|uniref:CRISPR system Cms protein Csm5 n=1 Tax=Flectobacillus roseus TaxID=502259 RepID=A0ABT6Y5X7_9BACT|nr:type III-A CRISPR-associated RAMP protein Csm5 [Flectobacillus roseus]MDI9858942.1 type III-A CRISPR-associated RAMP protein Csm5 [Flectobacillus roseus]
MAGLNHTYHFKIKTLSPISIGNEQEAVTSFSEYIYDNDYLYYLDLNSLKGIDNVKIDAFIQGMQDGMYNNSFRDNFSKLVQDTLEVDIETLMTGEKYRIRGLEPGHSLSLRGLLKTRNCPYISGSTMKGAIKSSILYNWLMSEGKNELKEFVKYIDQVCINLEKKIQQCTKDIVTSNLFSNEQKNLFSSSNNSPIINFIRFLNFQNLSEKQSKILSVSKREITEARIKIENEFTKSLEAKLFPSKKQRMLSNGKPYLDDNRKPIYDDIPYDSSYLRVLDTPSIDNQSIVVEYIKRVNIYNEKANEAIPFLIETIEADTRFDFQIQIPSNNFKLNQIFHPSLKFLQSKEMYKTLFKIINRFSEDFIKEELSNTSNVSLKSFYEGLESEINKGDEAIIRIGFGKHFLNNSMALAVKQVDKTVYGKLIELFMESENSEDFPSTRVLTSNNQPLGWMKIQFVSSREPINPPKL